MCDEFLANYPFNPIQIDLLFSVTRAHEKKACIYAFYLQNLRIFTIYSVFSSFS